MGSPSNQLILAKCRNCGKLFIPPAYTCSACSHTAFQEAASSGEGSLLSYTKIRVPPLGMEGQVPYDIGVVRLKEDLNLVARIVGEGEFEIGDPVSFMKKDPNAAYWFKVGKNGGRRTKKQ